MRLATAIAMISLAVSSGSSIAQTYTWNGAAGNGNWNASGNWTGGLPTSSSSTIIELNNTTQTTTIQNLADPFSLNQLIMLPDASNGFVVNGQALQFLGTNAEIQSQAAALLDINAPVLFGVNTVIAPTANNTSGGEIRFGGPLFAASGVTVNVGSGSSVLGGLVILDASSAGFNGTWAVSNGAQTQVSAVNALSRVASVSTSGNVSGFLLGRTTASGFSDVGTGIQLSSVSGTGSFQVGTTDSPSYALVGFGNSNFSITGTGTLTASNAGSHFAKVGTGTMTHSGGQGAFNGSFSVRDGTLLFAGSSGSNGGFGTASTGPITIYSGAQIQVALGGNGSNGRIGNSQPVNLAGGTYTLDASTFTANANGYSDPSGALGVGPGESTLRIITNAARGSRLFFTSLSQSSSTGTLFLRSDNLGTSALNTVGSGNVNFAANPDGLMVGTTAGYTAGSTNLRILPFGYAASSSSGAPSTFVAYDTTNASLRGLADGDYAGGFGAADLNVSLNSVGAANATVVNALRLTAGGSVITSGTGLTITSGALLNNGGGDVTGTGPVNFGPGGASTAYLTTNGTASITAPIFAANLAKGGAGNLTVGAIDLSGATGPRAIAANSGVLSLTGVVTPGTLSPTNTLTYQVARGATLDASATGLTIGTNQILAGGGTQTTGAANTATVAGALIIGDGGTIQANTLGGANGTSPGALNLDGNVTFQTGGTYEWFINSILGADVSGGTTTYYTQSLLNATGALDLTSLNSANRFNIRVTTLDLANNPGQVYDYDGESYTVTIANFDGGINGFDQEKFTLQYNPADFANGGAFLSIGQLGNSLVLNVTPVPEPAALLVVGLAGAGIAVLRRRRRSADTVLSA